MRITVIVTEAEHAELKQRAGDVPLSRWIRKQLLPSKPKTWVEESAEQLVAEIEVAEKKLKAPKSVDTSICQHGFFKSACQRCK